MNEFEPSLLVKKSFEFIAKKRSSADTSVLFVNFDDKNEKDHKYHLLTVEKSTFTARTYVFDLNEEDLVDKCVSEITLVPIVDLEIEKFELRDFKVSEKDNQYHLLFRLKDGYKSKEVKNFAIIIYSSFSGELDSLKEFNFGAEEIKETGLSHVTKPEKLEPLYDAYFDHSSKEDGCKIIEFR